VAADHFTDYKPRRPLDSRLPDGYLESDKDYVANNLELAVRLLEEHGAKLEKFGFGKKTQ
jgi:hypothetical protein